MKGEFLIIRSPSPSFSGGAGVFSLFRAGSFILLQRERSEACALETVHRDV